MPPITLKRFLLYRSGRAEPCPPRLTHTLCCCNFIYATMGRLKKRRPKKLSGRLKSSGPKKRKQIILIRHLYVPYCEKGVGILTDSCMKFNVFAFSASDFAARRTIVRLARRNRTLQTILSLPFAGRLKKRRPKKLSGRLKKRRPKKRIRAIIRLLFGTNTMKADEILSDFSKGMIIRFFYRRNTSLPYACTATRRVSTILHLFYLSPLRVG